VTALALSTVSDERFTDALPWLFVAFAVTPEALLILKLLMLPAEAVSETVPVVSSGAELLFERLVPEIAMLPLPARIERVVIADGEVIVTAPPAGPVPPARVSMVEKVATLLFAELIVTAPPLVVIAPDIWMKSGAVALKLPPLTAPSCSELPEGAVAGATTLPAVAVTAPLPASSDRAEAWMAPVALRLIAPPAVAMVEAAKA